jgi:signal transduction histidine kinase
VIGPVKAFAKRHWPALHLRTILLTVLLFAAAMPGLTAIFLRVYENTLVRQTEAELVAQSAALAAMAAVSWPGANAEAEAESGPPGKAEPYYQPENTTIDLRGDPILPERPQAPPARIAPDPAAVAVSTALDPVIRRTARTTLASVLVLDRHGQIVHGPGLGGDLSGLPEVRAALAGRPSTVLRRNSDYHARYSFEWLSRASDIRLHHARPVEVRGQVVAVLLVSRSPRALFRGVYEDRGKIALGVIGIFGMLIFLAGLVSRGVTRPIEGLSRASREVALGRGAVPETPATAAIEIRALYEDFRAMADAIERRSRYLRDFAAAVSHEFKTPLAGIGGAVELLQDHGATMSEAERARFLANILADNARLTQLVTDLLDMARADMARPEAGASVDLRQPTARVVDSFAGRNIALAVDLPPGLASVGVPEATLEKVLCVLIENSLQAGAHDVDISARTVAGGVCLAVSDDGPGFPEQDRERMFEPFFTSRRADGGTGLGLPIARSLLAASGASIAAVHSQHGARFEMRLPYANLASA